MQLSYAQNLEDYTLDLVFQDVAAGTYVDVGGGHPVADNVSFYAYLKGWRGLVVEPQDDLARLYAGVRPRDHVVSHLAGRSVGEIDFHVVEGMHGLSSAVAANAESARRFGAATRVIKKKVAPLSTLIDQAGLTQIDFLKIDVEGAEPDVLAGLDLKRHRPRVILVEAVNPNNLAADVSAWEPRLLEGGYTFVFFDNLNRFYLAKEEQALASRFPAVPAPWERVAHLWDCGRASQRPEHPDRVLADVLVAGLMAELPKLAAEHPALLQALVARGMATAGGPKVPPPTLGSLLGTAERPRPVAPSELASLDALVKTDAFRAALGRIACMYDGGHLLE
jgi:FkbM family methyltransferase